MLLPLVIGCVNPYYTGSACDHDVGDWFGGIGRYVWWGEELDKKVSFDVQLAEEYVKKVSGSYDKVDGTIEYTLKYVEDYWLQTVATASDYESFGTVYRNGNLDIIEKRIYTDILGDSWAVLHREERKACEGTFHERFSDSNGDIQEEPTVFGTYTITGDNKVEMSRTDFRSGVEWVEESTFKSNFTVEGTRWADSGDYSAAESFTTLATGARQSDWWQESGSTRLEGTSTWTPAGLEVSDYAWFESGEKQADIHVERAYDGNGTGTYTFTDGSTCDLTFRSDGTCSYTCSDGSKGNDC